MVTAHPTAQATTTRQTQAPAAPDRDVARLFDAELARRRAITAAFEADLAAIVAELERRHADA
jgi:hypothetical protein